jgi:hypothetical protein
LFLSVSLFFPFLANFSQLQSKNQNPNPNQILIKKAYRLNEKKQVLADITGLVNAKDDEWTTITNNQYIRVIFEKPLDSTKDITLYARPSRGTDIAKVEVFPKNSNKLITTFENVDQEKEYKVYLTNITQPQDTFDLKITGKIDIDFITDPSFWTERKVNGGINWVSITSSSDGTKLAAVVSGGYIYTSTDSGASWTERTSAGLREWQSITSSSDGTKLAAVDIYGSSFTGGYIYTSTDSGSSWTERTSAGSRYWQFITSSSDGTKLAAVVRNGYIYTSTDSGSSWTERTGSGSRTWYSIASSSDGTRLAAVVRNGYIYTSTDSGSSWTEQTSSGSRYWQFITSSSDGTRLAAVVRNGYIYTSTDSGGSWTGQTGTGSRTWYSIASSSDGTRLAANAIGSHNYTSSDSGVTWTERSGANIRGGNWKFITSSSDGTKLAAIVSGGYIYTSTDSGGSWTGQTGAGSRSWSSITSSSEGTKLAAVVSGGYIYTSTDSGGSWTGQTGAGSRSWSSITSSSDGTKLTVAVNSGGYIYSGEYYEMPLSSLSSSGDTKDNVKPVLSFKKSSTMASGISSYSVSLDPGKNKSYSITGIPASGNGSSFYTWRDDTDTKVWFTGEDDSDSSNDTINVYFKGLDSSELTEGKHTWSLTTYDSVENSTSKSFDLYIDKTLPTLTNLSISGVSSVTGGSTYSLTSSQRMPVFTGKVSDPSQGSEKTNSNGTKDTFDAVSSGVDKITLTVKKLGVGGVYKTYLTKDYSVSGDFSVSTPFPLTDGKYEVGITIGDKAGNVFSSPPFYLTLGVYQAVINTPFSITIPTSKLTTSQTTTGTLTETPLPTPSDQTNDISKPTGVVGAVQTVFSVILSFFKNIFSFFTNR